MQIPTSKLGGTLLFAEECYQLQGAIFEVYREMGPGFLESVYQECLEREFLLRNIPFHSQYDLQIHYKGELLAQKYRTDFLCFNTIIVEIKAVTEVSAGMQAQLINYLKATRLHLGLLVNFHSIPKASIERFAN